jgi:hypothetical protein
VRLVDIGVDAARILQTPGRGRVCAVFRRALYLRTPGGLVVLVSTQAPRGPLHLRVAELPAVEPGCPVQVDADSLRVGEHTYPLAAPLWSGSLPPASAFLAARRQAERWLSELGPTLDLGSSRPVGLPAGAVAALGRGDLLSFAALVGGRGPGLTPAGDDMLAGVLLVARISCGASPAEPALLLRCARRARTNDIARAFLSCAARGRCIEPVHELLAGLADADHLAVRSAEDQLHRFGSSSGAALTYGVRVALLELPGMPDLAPVSALDQG